MAQHHTWSHKLGFVWVMQRVLKQPQWLALVFHHGVDGDVAIRLVLKHAGTRHHAVQLLQDTPENGVDVRTRNVWSTGYTST